MKTKWYLIIGFTLIYILSFLIPFTLICGLKTEDSISLASSISASIATFLTLIIVILFFDKYGLQKTVFDKAQTQMINLIDLICDLTLKGKFSNGGFLNFNFSKSRLEHFKNQKDSSDKKVLFTDDYWNGLSQIMNIQTSVWTPKAIRQKLSSIVPNSISELKDFNKDEYVIISLKDNYNFVGLFNDTEITLKEFIFQCEELLDEINKWIKKYGGIPNDFEY